jgi:aspartyl/asparaginyl beta-hydroxylase (cupin superfamily)
MAALPDNDVQVRWKRGAEALRGGDARAALAHFRAIAEAGRADATVWIAIAMATRSLDDNAGHLAALGEALKLEPRNLRALMMKGDHYAGLGDHRAAQSFYSAVTKLAETANLLPADLAADVARAHAALTGYTQQYERHLQAHLEAHGLGEPGTARIAESLDLLLGRKAIFRQEPRIHYFPGLPQIQFYDRAGFPWLDGVEAAWRDIRAELLEVLTDESAFAPYIQGEGDRPAFDEIGLLGDPSWSAFYLWENGEPVEKNIARCPKTAAALAEAPLCRIPGRTPSVLFSLLRPGAKIAPHTGFMNSRLICHLPLIVPPGCGFRVGNDARSWEEGRAWAFDDTIEHEAWNGSDRLRVVMIFDIWRPELTGVERGLVSETLKAIDSFTGERTDLSV